MKRTSRKQLGQETVAIVDRGEYTIDGRTVNLAPLVSACCDATQYFAPEDLKRLQAKVLVQPAPAMETVIDVRNETTLAGIARLLAEGEGPVAALNFASAKNPGGGFLGGSQAQEESLARSSALYASLLCGREYYEKHRALPSSLYSDAMILSPGCPIFRDDDGNLLSEPYLSTFLTSAAPNAGAVANNRPKELPLIPEILRQRSELVLALAAASGCERLVLGAWGCGVFRNDPMLVAGIFADHLNGLWAGRFRRIAFSVLDTWGGTTLGAFQKVFPGS